MFSFFCFITFFYFLLSTNALPTPFEKRGVSSSLVSQFSLFGEYAAAAYCKDNNSNLGSISCSSGNCPQVQQAGAQTIVEFEDLGVADATGFVAVDDINKLIVLSYRGSASLKNWISNVNIDWSPYPACKNCQVHRGFLSSWADSKDTVKNALNQAKAAHPDYKIVFSGHSLGGAIATLAAADLRTLGFNIALYTYGSPMVGNGEFANFVTNQAGGNYRVTHAFDIVPKLPGYLLQYRHVSPEYWVTSPGGKAVGAGDINMSSGTLNLWGNQGTLISNISDHLWYFNAISACTSGFEL